MTPEMRQMKIWREHPETWVQDTFHITPDDWQAEGLRALANPSINRIAVRSAKGPGKTAYDAFAIWWFMATQGEIRNHPTGAATSISGDNLRDCLWSELARWRSRSPLLMREFEWTASRIFHKRHPDTWFFSARAWPRSGDTTQQANTLAGIHSDYVLFVLDESGGIPKSVAVTAEGVLGTGKWAKVIQTGNPTHNDGPLFDACTKERGMWHVIEVTGDPDDPKRSKRINIEWAKGEIEKYGRDNPWVMVNVLGKFPPQSINALLSTDEVMAAINRHVRDEDYAWSQKRLGVDVARFGDDRTVIFPRQGLASFEPVIMRGARTTDIAARVAKAKADWNSEVEFVDDTGHWGHGVIDNLYAAGCNPIPVMYHGPPTDPRYKNKRAEMWMLMAEWVKRGGSLPNIPELVGELTTPTYSFINGKFTLEDKDQVKSRLGRSPDLGDALAQTFAMPDLPSQFAQGGAASNRHLGTVEHEYNPHQMFDEA